MMKTQELRTMSAELIHVRFLLLSLLLDDMREETHAHLVKAQHAIEAAIIHEEKAR